MKTQQELEFENLRGMYMVYHEWDDVSDEKAQLTKEGVERQYGHFSDEFFTAAISILRHLGRYEECSAFQQVLKQRRVSRQ